MKLRRKSTKKDNLSPPLELPYCKEGKILKYKNMTSVKTIISTTKPQVLFGLWLKPVEDGFAAYIINSGTVKPLKVVDDKNTEDTKDDEIINLVGSVKDSKSANTINGAKAYAKDVKNTIIGKESDTPSDLTLHGLKNYIDSKIYKNAKYKNTKA